MIKELNNKFLLHKDNPIFIKYFCSHKRTEIEKSKVDELNNLLLELYRKMFDKNAESVSISFFPYEFSDYGYLENYGYYIVREDNWGYYLISNYGENINKILISLSNIIIDKKASISYKGDKKNIKKDMLERFNKTSDIEELFHIEYALKKWYKYFDGIINEEILNIYLNRLSHLNSDNITYEYDANNNQIISKQNKTKKLIRR